MERAVIILPSWQHLFQVMVVEETLYSRSPAPAAGWQKCITSSSSLLAPLTAGEGLESLCQRVGVGEAFLFVLKNGIGARQRREGAVGGRHVDVGNGQREAAGDASCSVVVRIDMVESEV